ncbi:MFS transporter [Reinekea marinisedimentorum]|uniref:Putative MFS family arabinose efflux permease n=1 Tax=Reinekea marinisedimentorum TaxID=230495 RepID=A0A4R3IE45_9GAMM|nr:MFS transporter [Reinekea marinisedimentorum]TCS44027.1 putative MFS family arabinose efflux permease [Reinekea marinisedimentorum]
MFNGYLQLFKRYWAMLCFGMLAVFWGNFGQSFFISWFGASIQHDLNLSATAYGSAYSLATLGSGITLMFIGNLLDKWQLQTVVIFSALGLMCAALLMWQVNSFILLIVAFYGLRLFGQGMFPHIGGTTMARFFSQNRGKALSVSSCGVPLGEMILPSLVLFVIPMFGWQSTWLIIALVGPLLFLPVAFRLLKIAPEPEALTKENETAQAKIPQGSRRTVLQDRRFWCALPLVLMPPFVVTAVFIHHDYILAGKGWSAELFAASFALYGLVHWASSIFSGALVDRFSAKKTLSFMGLPFIAAFFLSMLSNSQALVFVLMFFMGAGIAMTGPVVGSLWAEVYGTANLGAIRSLTTSMMIVSTAAASLLLGVLIDVGFSANGLLLVLACYAVAATALSRFSYTTK